MKKITLFLITFSFLFAFDVFAQSPEVLTLSANNIEERSAYLRAEFDGEEFDVSIPFPVVWFEYGKSSSDLDYKTSSVTKFQGNYVFSERVSGLDSDEKYYFRVVMRHDGDTDHGRTLSFKTKEKKETSSSGTNSPTPVNQGFLSPAELMEQYNNSAQGTQNNQNSGSNNSGSSVNSNSSTNSQSSSNSFWSIFGFGNNNSQNNESSNENSNLVHSEKEIEEKTKEPESTTSNSETQNDSDRKKDKDSAAYDDEYGEVIEFNYDTGYKGDLTHNYNQKSTVKQNRVGNTPNYPVLILIIILLIVVMSLAYATLRKRRKVEQTKHVASPGNPGHHGAPRYHIPKRDVHDPRQNPNRATFNRVGKK